jgi:TPR repeat protein
MPNTFLNLDFSAIFSSLVDLEEISAPQPPGQTSETGAEADPAGQYKTALCALEGIGVAKDPPKALEILQSLSDRGFFKATCKLVQIYCKNSLFRDPDKAINLLQSAVETGPPNLKILMAAVYLGAGGQSHQNTQKGLEWLQKAADEDHAQAVFLLGLAYYQGFGVKKDIPKARSLYIKAADLGFHKAQLFVGTYYLSGLDPFALDFHKARHYLSMAADQDEPDASYFMAAIYIHGMGVKQDYNIVRKYLEKASGQGHSEAQFNMAILYFNAFGVKEDIKAGFYWLRQAYKNGHQGAKDTLETLSHHTVTDDTIPFTEEHRKMAESILATETFGYDGYSFN